VTIHVPAWLVWWAVVVLGSAILLLATYALSYYAWEVGKMAFYASGVWGWAMRLWVESARARHEGRPVPEYRMPRPGSITRRPPAKEGGANG
jgi:hypothetical protein